MKTGGRRSIRIGVGGWTYQPWRGTFFPPGLPQKQELHHASRQLTAIEVNGTYYSTMKRESFRKWHDETPENFVFSLKASRHATNRNQLATAGDSIERFLQSGIDELKGKLGPIVWQFMPTKRFDADDFSAFLQLLPNNIGGRVLRHVMDVRHESFACDAYLTLARRHKVATVYTDAKKFPRIEEPTSDLMYARLMNCSARFKSGYAPKALDALAGQAQAWAENGSNNKAHARDVFIFFINGAKEKAPAAAGALIERMGKA
ncbi:MAG: DUF72 domain-containing protein [Burkholderiales bacterium]